MRDLLDMVLTDDIDGVFAISMVSEPAVKSNFIYMSKQKVTLAISDEEKQIVTGLILEPDTRIFRKNFAGYDEVDITFSSETVEAVSQKYLKDMNQKNVTVEHNTSVENVTLVESWIKVHDEHDKSVALGIDAKPGSWFGSFKVDNPELIADIKAGKFKGLSIEALLKPNKVDLSLTNKEESMKQEETPQVETPTEEVQSVEASQENITPEEIEAAPVIDTTGTSVASKILAKVKDIIGMTDEAPESEPEQVENAEDAPTYVTVEAFNSLRSDVDTLMEAVSMLIESMPVKQEEVQASEEVQEAVEPEEEPDMVSLSDSKPAKSVKIEYRPGQTTQDRIRESLGLS